MALRKSELSVETGLALRDLRVLDSVLQSQVGGGEGGKGKGGNMVGGGMGGGGWGGGTQVGGWAGGYIARSQTR